MGVNRINGSNIGDFLDGSIPISILYAYRNQVSPKSSSFSLDRDRNRGFLFFGG